MAQHATSSRHTRPSSTRNKGFNLTLLIILLFTFAILSYSIIHIQDRNRPHNPAGLLPHPPYVTATPLDVRVTPTTTPTIPTTTITPNTPTIPTTTPTTPTSSITPTPTTPTITPTPTTTSTIPAISATPAPTSTTTSTTTTTTTTTTSPSQKYPLPIILYWTPVSGFMGKTWLKSPERCPVACEFTEVKDKLSSAGAVAFLLPSVSASSKLPEKQPNQTFVIISMESDLYYKHMNDKKFMSNFELTMTYKLSSNISTMYMSSKANYSNTPDEKTAKALVSIFISNSGPLNRRNEAVKALMDLIPCHSFGHFSHNQDLGTRDKKKTLRQYKFHLAFENSDTPDYVTEKVFHALDAGTVPVYMGAPNIDQFMPSNHSIIKVADFDYDYKKLADYLLYLDKHDDEYQKYLEWKTKPFTGNFKKIQDYIKVDARCKLCMFLNGLPLPKLELD